MTTNDSDHKDSIAEDLGWESYAAAPGQVQRNIDAQIEGSFVTDPFAPLRRGGD